MRWIAAIQSCSCQYSGPDFVTWSQDLLKGHVANLHLTGQIIIDFESEDLAFGEVYYFAYHRLGEGEAAHDLIIAGRYVDRYERRDQLWKIAHRSELIDWVRSDSASEGTVGEVPGALRGGHGAVDRSNQRDWLRTA